MLGPENHPERLALAVRNVMSEKSITLAAIESCTGGMVASILTDVDGAGYFLGGAVAYDVGVKERFGVPGGVIERCGIVSGQVAHAMAQCAAEWFGADYGLGITGVAGSEPEDGILPGTAYAAVWNKPRGGRAQRIEVTGERRIAKAQMACLALGLLLDELDSLHSRGSTAAVEAWIGR